MYSSPLIPSENQFRTERIFCGKYGHITDVVCLQNDRKCKQASQTPLEMGT